MTESFDNAPAIVVIGSGTIAADEAARAVALVGGRIAASIDWAGIDADVMPGTARALWADARGVDEEALALALPQLVDLGQRSDVQLVIALARPQLDTLALDLLDAGAVVLCEPMLAESVGALSLALATADSLLLHDTSSEAARLDRLNSEVARIAETLARLARREDLSSAPPATAPFVGDRMMPFAGVPLDDAAVDPNEIRQTIRSRRLRDELFESGSLFEDPAWDMLLDLFAARLEHRQVSVSSLCIAAAVPPTTALRWIGKLMGAGLLDRRPDTFDRRRAFIGLTDRAAAAMHRYVTAAKRAGLPIA